MKNNALFVIAAALDGEFCQLTADGTACLTENSMKTPLATVASFGVNRNRQKEPKTAKSNPVAPAES